MKILQFIFASLLLAALTACGGGSSSSPDMSSAGSASNASNKSGSIELLVLSNRADLISGGNALVEVVLTPGPAPSFEHNDITMQLNGIDVTNQFALRDNGRYMGVLEGLEVREDNMLIANLPNNTGSRITIDNHPIGGPIFSGAHSQPWVCTTGSNNLGAEQDSSCNADTVIELFYRNNAGSFQSYDPDNPPNDVANTTTDEGMTVPYIIRQETGTHNRGIYRLAVLFDPEEEWTAWDQQPQWNNKLHYPFGASCGTNHTQGSAQGVQNHRALSRGFMVATSSLNVLGHSCNTTTSAESVMMLKEHIIENYGEIRYTMAEGCSGGAIGQQMVANSYPGLLQGIQPNCSYMDNWTTGQEVVDCQILLNYYESPSTLIPPGSTQAAAVNGHQGYSSCVSWRTLFSPAVDPEGGCSAGTGTDYDPDTNPTGCRGSVPDYNINIIGKRSSDLWNDSPNANTRAAEAMAGGFARFPYDNIGVQYGFNAVMSGEILPEQFVHLNENIGSVDVDFNFAPDRRPADTGSETLYPAGGVNDGNNLDQVVMIDLRGSSNNEIHTDYHSWAMQDRLKRRQGLTPNQRPPNHAIWSASTPLVVPPSVAEASFELVDSWLAAVEADTRNVSRAQKVADNKPADAVNTCFGGDANAGNTDETSCRAAIPYFASPRVAAGGPLSHDVTQCVTKAFDRADYAGSPTPFTDGQLDRLEALFGSTGVCDWSQRPTLEEPSIGWMTYEDGPGLGRPLPAPPVAENF